MRAKKVMAMTRGASVATQNTVDAQTISSLLAEWIRQSSVCHWREAIKNQKLRRRRRRQRSLHHIRQPPSSLYKHDDSHYTRWNHVDPCSFGCMSLFCARFTWIPSHAEDALPS